MILQEFIAAERTALGDFDEVHKALGSNKRHFELLPHLKRVSDASLSMLQELRLLRTPSHRFPSAHMSRILVSCAFRAYCFRWWNM